MKVSHYNNSVTIVKKTCIYLSVAAVEFGIIITRYTPCTQLINVIVLQT